MLGRGILWTLLVATCINCGGKPRAFGSVGGAGGSDPSPGGQGSDDGGVGGSGGADDDAQAGLAGAAGSPNDCVHDMGGVCEFGCAQGVCAPDPCASVTCVDPDVCQDGPGQCDSRTGQCSYPAAADHTECGANLECTGGDCQCTVASCPDGCCSAAGVCGSCTPTTLTTRPVAIQALTISSPLLYLLEGHVENDPEVYSLSTKGGDAQLISVPPPGDKSLTTIAADQSFIYGASFSYDKVGRMPTSGGPFTNISGSKTYSAQRLLLNNASVFTGFGLSSNAINVFPKAGGTAITLVDSLTIDFIHFAVDDSSLYFVSSGQTVLNRMPITGGAAAQAIMATEAGEKVADVSVAGNQLIVASNTRVAKVSVTGGTVSTLDVGSAYALATDGTNALYFRAKGDNEKCASGSEVFSVPLAGGTVRRLAIETTKSCVRSVVQDASGVYWLADQSIKKVAK